MSTPLTPDSRVYYVGVRVSGRTDCKTAGDTTLGSLPVRVGVGSSGGSCPTSLRRSDGTTLSPGPGPPPGRRPSRLRNGMCSGRGSGVERLPRSRVRRPLPQTVRRRPSPSTTEGGLRRLCLYLRSTARAESVIKPTPQRRSTSKCPPSRPTTDSTPTVKGWRRR